MGFGHNFENKNFNVDSSLASGSGSASEESYRPFRVTVPYCETG
jgi:hypothetical protein